jgi:hypothetical protein
MATFDSNLDAKQNAGTGGGTIIIEDEGSTVTGGPFSTLDFVGAGVTATDGGGGTATITIPGGGGGVDTYTAPNEYFVDPTLSVDATKRQYQTIAAALAAATVAGHDPIVIRVAEGQSHNWDGTNLTAAGVDVYIYCPNPSPSFQTEINIQNPTALLSDYLLSFHNVTISAFTNVTVGVQDLLLDHCNGDWYVETVNPPTPGFQSWTFRHCDLRMSVSGGASETGEGQLEVLDSRIQGAFTPIWDHSASVDGIWTLRFRKTLIEAVDPDPDPAFVGNTFLLGIGFQDVTFVVSASFTQMTLFSGDNPPSWETSRIIEGILDKGGGGFTFGVQGGIQAGLEIEYGETGFNSRLPIDCPDGTTARTTLQGSGTSAGGAGLFGQFSFHEGAEQWRSANNGSILGGVTINANSVPTFLETITEGDPMIDLDPTGTGTGSLHTLKGRITADNPSVNDGAIWDSDIVLRADSAPTNTVTILVGAVPTAVYESSVGQYTLQTLPGVEARVLSTPVTGTLTINGTVLTAVAGPRTPGSDDFNGSIGSSEAIVVVNVGFQEFEIVGDFTVDLPTGTTITVSGSTGNDGTYTVDTSSFSGGNTVIVVLEAIPDPTADGTIAFDASRSVAAEIAAAVNDAANSFAALAQVNSDGRSDVVAIVATSTAITLLDGSGQISTAGWGLSYVVTRNSGSSNTRLSAEIQITEGRIF